MSRTWTMAGVILAIVSAAVVAFALPHPDVTAFAPFGDAVYHAAPFVLAAGLEPLRAQHRDLVAVAAAKIAEVKPGLADDAVRAIETEHAEMVRNIASVAAAITAEEARGNPPARPANTPSAEQIERTRVLEITAACRTFNVEVTAMEGMIQRGITADAARGEIQTIVAQRSQANRQTPQITIGQDEGDALRRAVESSIVLRVRPNAIQGNTEENRTLLAAARNWRGMSLLEAGRVYTEEVRGVKLRGLSRRELATVVLGMETRAGMHSTSDFANILANVASKRLRDAYTTAPKTFQAFCRPSTNPDFKQKSVTQLSSAPAFKQVKEGGEYSYGAMSDGVEKYALSTFGRIIAITRQALINDDLGAFDRLPTMYGQAAASLESDTVYNILLANPTMGDGVALFHANHGNLPAAADIDETNLGVADKAMRDQKGFAAKAADAPPLNLIPKFLIVGTTKRVKAQKLLSAVIPNATSGVNVFQNSMDLITEARVTGNKWFLSADPNTIDTIEYAYLEGEEGVFTEQRIGFEVDGLEIKARLDFAAKAIDWRGLVYNSGA